MDSPSKLLILLAPRERFELPTNGLTVRRSTTELPGNAEEARIVGKPGLEVKKSRRYLRSDRRWRGERARRRGVLGPDHELFTARDVMQPR